MSVTERSDLYSVDIVSFLNLIRALFPYWSFFAQTAYTFQVSVYVPETESWIPLTFTTKFKNNFLLCNPTPNYLMAQFNVVEHFARDIQDHTTDVHALTTYKLLCSILRIHLPDDYPHSTFQFKIVAKDEINTVELFRSGNITKEPVCTD